MSFSCEVCSKRAVTERGGICAVCHSVADAKVKRDAKAEQPSCNCVTSGKVCGLCAASLDVVRTYR